MQTKEERRVYALFAKILIIRLVVMILMIFPAVWKNSGAIGTHMFYVLWIVGFGVIFSTAVYGFIIEIKAKVSAFTYLGITTASVDSNPVFYLIFLLIGVAVAMISGVFIYGCFIALGWQ